MYLPQHFAQTDHTKLYELITQSPLGILITHTHAGIEANHLPFELDAEQGAHGSLYCHVARANTVWQRANLSDTDSLAIFQGPSAYISPSLYASKKTTHEVVPTYNYAVVHVYGRIIVHDDARWLRGMVGRLTKRFEMQQETPWKMSDAPPSYIDERLKHIVGLEIQITRIEGKWKMSQNRDQADRMGVIAGLMQSADEDERSIAAIMQQRQTAADDS
ncbi:FMN-binding negative transcriptional regulator [Herminiimonas fonticola]|uniref:FMN-binding negative transcriptional regulator n=1 Tax=Herminiimonas fonticola TaxID=303380 RepID=UPI00333E339D